MSVIREVRRGALSARMLRWQDEDNRRKRTNKSLWLNENAAATRSSAASGAKESERQRRGLPGGRGAINRAIGQSWEALSTMPAELVAFFVRWYLHDMIPAGGGALSTDRPLYLDPFAGQGVQLQVARLLGVRYQGVDACARFVRWVERARDQVLDGWDPDDLQIHLGDSRAPTMIVDGSGDFGFTSPPYWDVEFYDDGPTQLGVGKTYDQFLVGMTDVARAWLPKFRPGAPLVVNVGDFSRGGRFYPYSAHTVAAFEAAGWRVADCWILEGLVGGLSKVFAADRARAKLAPKVHEYCWTFRRPDEPTPGRRKGAPR